MAVAASWLLLLFFLPFSRSSDCDLGPSDVIFLVKASHLLPREDFLNIKEFMRTFSETLEIGRDNTTTHVGAVFFDNIGPPQTRIPLTAYSRLSDLQMAIDHLSQLPCGADWCKETETTFRPALDYAMSRFSKGRMKKLVLIHSGREEPSIAGDIQDLTSKDPWLRVLHIFIKGYIQENTAEQTYLTAYHEPYKRFDDEFKSKKFQLRGEDVPIVSEYKYSHSTSAHSYSHFEECRTGEDHYEPVCFSSNHFGNLFRSETLLKLNDEVCQQLFSCPPCAGIIGGKDPFDKETPLQSRLPTNWKTQVKPSVKKTSTNGLTEDYEYEITADPPGMVINNNPALKNLKMREASTAAPATSIDYVYEDNATPGPGMKKKRSKRAYMSPRQRDCTCKAPINFNLDSAAVEPSRKEAEGCSGSSSSVEGAGTSAGGCGGSQVSYQPAQYYPYYTYSSSQSYGSQYYYPQYSPQYSSQYVSPCRGGGSPCQQRNWYYPYSSPCARSPCSAQYPQYPQYTYYYPQYYGYTYAQTAQPQTEPQVQVQPQSDSYVTPAASVLPADSVHEGVVGERKEEKSKNSGNFKLTSNEIFEKLAKFENYVEKDERPTDPFNARAFGGGQLKRIPSGSVFESIITPAPPAIDSILGQFPEPIGEGEATIPARPVTPKPADIGSSLSEVEDITSRKKRLRRTIHWGSHPWHYHIFNHFASPTSFNWNHARAHAAPLYSPSLMLPTSTAATTTTTRALPCEVMGTDVVIYIDDVGEMKPSEFNTAKIYVHQIWVLLNREPKACHEMSRMAVMKTSKKGDVILQADFSSAEPSMPKESLIDYMEYTGCSTRIPFCDQSLPKALIMASNLLSMQSTDREKLVIVISSRPSSSLERQFESLIEARDYLAQTRAGIIYVALREETSPIGLHSNLQNLIRNLCILAPKSDEMERRKKFCPWSPLPNIVRSANSTQQIFGK